MTQLTDFLGEPLQEGDFIVYPTNTAHQLVLAQIAEIKWRAGQDPWKVKVRRYEVKNSQSSYWNHRVGDKARWGVPDPARLVSLQYSHKLIKVPKPDWVEEYTEPE